MVPHEYQEIRIASTYAQARHVEDQIVSDVEQCGYGAEDLFAVRLSLEEALTNAIRHGNVGDALKNVHVRYRVSENRIDIYVADEGPGFDPFSVADPTTDENLECPSGRGIMLMRAFMTTVEYNEAGNVVHLVKLNKAG